MALQKMKPEYHDYLKYLIEYSYEILKNLDISKQVSFLCLNSMLENFNTTDNAVSEKMKKIHDKNEEDLKQQREVVKKVFEMINQKLENIDGSVDSFKELFIAVNMQMRFMSKEMEELKDSHYKLTRLLEEYIPMENKDEVVGDAITRADIMKETEYYCVSIKKPPVPIVEMKSDEIITHVKTDNSLKNILDEIFIEEEDEKEEIYDGDDHAINFMEWNYKDQEQHIRMKISYPIVEGMSKEKIRSLYSIMEEQVKRITEENNKKEDERREKMIADFKRRSEEVRERMMMHKPPQVKSIEDDLKERERVMEELRQGLHTMAHERTDIDAFAEQIEGMNIYDGYSTANKEVDILEDILDMEEETKTVMISIPNDEPPEPDDEDMNKGFLPIE
jgi:hypothetical protein